MTAPEPVRDTPARFIALTFALTLPFLIVASIDHRQLLPALPLSALAIVCPVGAACILRARSGGSAGVVALLRRAIPRRAPGAWRAYLLALLTMPLIMLAAWFVQRRTGAVIPVPHITAGHTVTLLIVLLAAAVTEELGWMGYAIDPMQDRLGAVRASITLGLVWAAWHFIPLHQVGRTPVFIGWWSLQTVSMRVLMVWLYNRAGRSVPVSIIFHAMINLTWMLYPIDGSYYDPKVTGIITALVTVVVIAGNVRRTT
jgi:uncharacterized protein